MCGIMGYVGHRPVVDVLLKGLKRLEYRGYDSAGVAFFKDRKVEIRKSEGKLANVMKLVNGSGAAAESMLGGIGHTRWATHGKPTTQNAHPHRTGHVVLVHNGIIENYQEIRNELVKKGFRPESETDSELYGFLVYEEMEKGTGLIEAARLAFLQLEGACSVVVMSEREPGTVVGIRNGSPLVAAVDPNGGAILASDAQPLLEYTSEVYFLENGDLVVSTEEGLTFRTISDGSAVVRKPSTLDWSPDQLDKKGFPHYMLKEIYEQPLSLIDTFNAVLDRKHADPFPLAAHPGAELLKEAKNIVFVACGTSWHAALLGKYWLERWAGVPVTVEYASEFRYRDPVLQPGSLIVAISQSGETADTLAVIREMRQRGIPTLGVTNTRGSTLSREADATFFTAAGPEIGVAATKTFTAQIAMLLMWAGFLGLRRGKDTAEKILPLFDQTIRLPHVLESVLPHPESGEAAHNGLASIIKKVAKRVSNAKGFFFIGRGYSFPIALEGALKLKEIAYIPAEGYAGGELKHGPIAMIDEGMVVVALAPRDSWYDKTVSNLQEVKARGAVIVGVGNPDDESLKSQSDEWIPLPVPPKDGLDESLYPFLLGPVVQMLSYEIAVLKGTDVDQPRNLAKSVTVE